MRINKALIDRALDVPSVNENAAMMYRRLISLIDQYNLLARDKGLPIKQIPVYGNNVNCALMSRLIGSIIKDIDRVKNIKEKEYPPKTARDVEFTDDKFNNDIWTYKIISGTENNTVSVGLNLDAFSEKFNGITVTLGYDDMPYEKLIDTDNTEYLTVSYERMFYDLSKTNVEALTIDNWTNRNVTDMSYMFTRQYYLQSLSLGNSFDTSNVTDMSSMFDYCYALQSLSLGNSFDTSNVTDMSSMFDYCYALQSLSLGNSFDTSNVTDMRSMFSDCYALQSLSLGNNFNTSNVTDMSNMFYSCWVLQSLSLGTSFDTSNVTDMRSMFSDCYALQSLSLGTSFNTSAVTNMSSMFSSCYALQSLSLYQVSTSIIKAFPSATWTIKDTESEDINTVNVTQGSSASWTQAEPTTWNNTPWTFYDPAKILNGVTFDGDTFTKDIWIYKIIPDTETVSVTLNDGAYLDGLTWTYDKMPYEKLITSNKTTYLTVSYKNMFGNTPINSTNLHLDGWSNRNVTAMDGMFLNRSELKSVRFSNFNTTNVTNMSNMFSGCTNLSNVDLDVGFNTTNVTNMSGMFSGCSSLRSLRLDAVFNTSKVTNMTNMFRLCSSLNSVTLYQPSSSIIKALPSATWTVKNNKPTEVNKVTVSEGVSASWTYDEPATWTLVPWTLSRTIQAQ